MARKRPWGLVVIGITSILVVLAPVFLGHSLLGSASAAPATNQSWKVFSITGSGFTLNENPSDPVLGGLGSFAFALTPNVSLFATHAGSYKGILLGDLGGKTLTAMISATVSLGTVYTYGGEGSPGNPCSSPASVRLYFQSPVQGTPPPASGFTSFWWSNPVSIDLQSLGTSPVNLQSSLSDITAWSDWNGQPANVDAATTAAFFNATHAVSLIGLSFGGGCFFENGVALASGTSTFELVSYTAA